MNLLPAVIANTRVNDGGNRCFEGRQGDVSWRMQKGQIGGVEERCGFTAAEVAKDTTTFSAVLRTR